MNQTNTNNDKQRVNIFFYSKVSRMCMDLLKLMDNYGVINQFYLRCIDDMAQVPPSLERVPTLIVIGRDKPLVAREAIEWFNNNRHYFIQQTSDTLNKNIMANIIRNNMQLIDGPKGYIDAEHNGISDSFAYTDVDMAQPKTYCEYKNDKTVIFTPPQDTKMNSTEQANSIKKLELERNVQRDSFKVIMGREQIEAVMNKERERLVKDKLGL